METMNSTIKIEPIAELQNDVSEISIGNIKHEPTTFDEPFLAEFDERIFQHNSSGQQCKEAADTDDHVGLEGGNFVFEDEIVKEEPIFYDPSEAKMLQSTQNDNENGEPSIHRGWQTLAEEPDSIDSPPHDDVDVLFKCSYCSETFHQKWIFHRHLKVHGVEQSFGCGLCSRKFGNKLQLVAHERIHKNQKASKQKQPLARKLAPKMDKSVKTSAEPGKKSKRKTPNDQKEQFKCQYCSRTFEQEGLLKHHETTHQTEKSFDCNLCARKFATKKRLAVHKRIHTGQQPFECEICHKKFNRKYHIDQHKRIHTGEKPFECTECGSRFRLKQHLEKHIEVRSKDGAHTLSGSSRNPIVPMATIMSEHALEIRIFECYLCHMQCYRHDLRPHIRTEHCGEKFYSCKICGKKISNKYKLSQHIKGHSAQPKLQCQVCGRQFLRKDSLKSHIATHLKSYQCKFCPKRLSTQHILKTHLKTHTGLRPFACDFDACKKTFLKRGDMVRHKRVHTGERPYTCDLCHKSFTRNHTLTEHKQKIHSNFEDK